MRSTSDSITFPLVDAPWFCYFTSSIFLLSGIVFAMFASYTFSPVTTAFFLALALGSFWLALRCITRALIRVHLVPEGIALSIMGKTYHKYPRNTLALAGNFVKTHYRAENLVLYISCHSEAQLARYREQQLQRNLYYRTNIKFRKRKGDWQEVFAREYLQKQARFSPWSIPGGKNLFLTDSPVKQAWLRKMFPELFWTPPARLPAHLTRTPSAVGAPKDAEPDTPEDFLQCHQFQGNLPLTLVFPWFVLSYLCPVIGLIITKYSPVWGVVLFIPFVLFFIIAPFLLTQLQRTRISAKNEGLYVLRNKIKWRFLPSEAIAAFFCIDCPVKDGMARYIIASTLTGQQMVRLEERRMSRTARGRELLSAQCLAETWPHMAQVQYLFRRMSLWGYHDRQHLVMAHSPQREAWLKERYPHVQWIEASSTPLSFTPNFL